MEQSQRSHQITVEERRPSSLEIGHQVWVQNLSELKDQLKELGAVEVFLESMLVSIDYRHRESPSVSVDDLTEDAFNWLIASGGTDEWRYIVFFKSS